MVSARGFALFETTVGSCGIAWGDRGIVGVQLPERDEGASRLRMRRRFRDATEMVPPVEVQRAIDSIVALLRGEPRDLAEVGLDMDGVQPFHRRVYEVARTIPPGSTLSYGDVAKRLGDPTAARAVGQALGQNPFPPIVPCHRVVAGDGTMHGFSAPGGVTTKLRLLTIEGWRASEPTLFD
jgi:methylated-DNA-[protein]-cysteine S-methyltransferase